jgi:hypothetical protein
MDRMDAMKVFVAALDEGGLARTGRKLGRSPAAVSRAVGACASSAAALSLSSCAIRDAAESLDEFYNYFCPPVAA